MKLVNELHVDGNLFYLFMFIIATCVWLLITILFIFYSFSH